MPPQFPKCSKCDRTATFQVTETREGEPTVYLLCEKHFFQERVHLFKGPEDPSALVDWLESFVNQQQTGAGHGDKGETGPTCPNCGHTYAAYRKTLLLGCTDCYKAFEEMLIKDLRKIHGAVSQDPKAVPDISHESAAHVEEQEPRREDQTAGNSTLAELQEEMKRAVTAEDFEKAAEVRDAIRQLTREGEAMSLDAPYADSDPPDSSS